MVRKTVNLLDGAIWQAQKGLYFAFLLIGLKHRWAVQGFS